MDAVTPWLLRVGIDHTGKIELTRTWDLAVRGAILADLWLCARINDSGETLEIDTSPTDVAYLDTAIYELATSAESPFDWLGRGAIRASDVADQLVDDGEWTRHRSITASQWRIYRSQAVQQHMPLRRRLAHISDGDETPISEAEASLALLGHALNVVRPDRYGRPRFRHWTEGCGIAAPVVDATVLEIVALSGSVNANSNPAW